MYDKIIAAVLSGDTEMAAAEAKLLTDNGVDPLQVIDQGLIVAMGEVGRLFKENEIFVPEVMMSAHTVTMVIEQLKPLLKEERASLGTIIIGTVKGDLHDIGKNLVALLLANNGFKVIDLGNDVSPERFVSEAKANNCDIIALSALLTTTMINMDATIKAFNDADYRQQVKIIIGGAPVTADYAVEINADGYSEDAASAVDLCKHLMQNQ